MSVVARSSFVEVAVVLFHQTLIKIWWLKEKETRTYTYVEALTLLVLLVSLFTSSLAFQNKKLYSFCTRKEMIFNRQAPVDVAVCFFLSFRLTRLKPIANSTGWTKADVAVRAFIGGALSTPAWSLVVHTDGLPEKKISEVERCSMTG